MKNKKPSELNRGLNMLTNVSIRKSLILAVGIATLTVSWQSALAQLDDSGDYTDRIHLKNGDVITGNLKELDRGKLRFKTRTMDTVYINWVNIESIDSDKFLRIERSDGIFHYGTIAQSDLENELVVKDRREEVGVPILAVSSIQPIRVQEAFWRRIEGDLSAGIDFKTASDILLINLATTLRFREEKYEVSMSANWNETSRTDDNNSSRADLAGDYTRFLRNRWFWRASTGLERNEELGLDLRTLVSGTVGKYLIQRPQLRLELNAGLAGNWEERQDGTSTSAEGVIRSSLEVFKHTLPVTRLSANVNVFPGITESGRMRVNTDITLRNEIVRSVFWDLTFFSNFDNRPPEGSSEEDYGIVTSIGASF
jgi:putative salt-induced outer membrane protein YdiY